VAGQWGSQGTPNPPSGDFVITNLSTNHAKIGATITINGRGFGASRGSSRVTFGEQEVSNPTPSGERKWAPVTKEAASYVSWSDSQIVVTVPSMSPGVEGYPGTYHNVRVYVGGRESNSANFYIDPDLINPASDDPNSEQPYPIAWSKPRSEYNWIPVKRTPNSNTTGGVQGYDYKAERGEGNNIENQAWLGNHIRGHNILFMNSTFTSTYKDINGDYGGVVTIGQGENAYNITFVNCTFKENWSTNDVGNFWHGINGVKIVSPAHDVTISDSTFERFSRMSYEVISWGESKPAYLAVRNSIFEPPGNQVISFGSGDDVYSLVENCLFKGWGNHEGMYPYGSAGWEANQARYIVTRNSEWWSGSTEPININQTPGRPSYLYFEDCRIYSDSTHKYSLQRNYMYQWGVTLSGSGLQYSRWKNCEFNTGDEIRGVESFGATSWGQGPVDWALNNNYNDFSGSTITGLIRKPNLHRPTSAAGYFDPSLPVLSGNILPRMK